MADYTINKTGAEIEASLAKADTALQSASIVDGLTSTDSTKVLSAKQGKVLNDKIPAASTSTPLMDGTASIGSSTRYAKADHRHPSDTTKQNVLTAGTGIDITGDVISCTGSSGGGGVTDVTMNGISKVSNGVAVLGNVLTSLTTPTTTATTVSVRCKRGTVTEGQNLPAATSTSAGVMTAEQVNALIKDREFSWAIVDQLKSAVSSTTYANYRTNIQNLDTYLLDIDFNLTNCTIDASSIHYVWDGCTRSIILIANRNYVFSQSSVQSAVIVNEGETIAADNYITLSNNGSKMTISGLTWMSPVSITISATTA